MKTPLLYGAIMALVGALASYGLFFAGYHDTPEKVQASQWVGSTVGIVAAVVCIALAMREQRAQYPASQKWGYGSAFGTGVLTVLWAALIGAVFAYVYFAIINPQFPDILQQVQDTKLEAKGLSGSQLEAAERMAHRFLTPVPMTVFNALGTFVGGVIISLLVAIFFRRRELPVAAVEAPPPLV